MAPRVVQLLALACALLASNAIGERIALTVDASASGVAPAPGLDCIAAASGAAEASRCAAASADDARAALDKALSRGFFDAAGDIIDTAAARGWDVSTTLHQKAGAIRARLAELVERLDGAATSVDIPPYVEWAQSPAAVFISVKWALGKAPATLGCAPSPPAVNGSAVVFRAVCALKRKTFAFAATLFAPLDAERCTFADASVGRATLTLAKAAEAVWPRLLNDSKTKTSTWWALAEDYEDATAAFRAKTPTPAPATPTPTAPGESASASASAAPAAADDEASATPGPTMRPFNFQ